jgi:hypothetical protein
MGHIQSLLHRVAPSARVFPHIILYSISGTQVLLISPTRLLRCADGPFSEMHRVNNGAPAWQYLRCNDYCSPIMSFVMPH